MSTTNTKHTETWYVQGMHCPACETLIEKKLTKQQGVSHVQAKLATKQLTIAYDKDGGHLSADNINAVIAKHGYSVTKEPSNQPRYNLNTIFTAMTFVGIVILVIYILEDMNIIAQFSVNETSSLFTFFGLGIVASISSCAALVGGLLLSLSNQWNSAYRADTKHSSAYPFIMFNIGRIVSFIVLGGLLGYAGSMMQLSLTFTAYLTLAVAICMIVIGLQMTGISWTQRIRLGLPKQWVNTLTNTESAQGTYMPFVIGAGTFFIPCGFTLLAQTVALTTGDPVTSAIMMGLFALGTLPMLTVLSFTSIKYQQNDQSSGIFNLVVGMLIIYFGLYTMNAQFNVLGLPSVQDITAMTNTSSQVQQVPTGLSADGLGTEIINEGGQQKQHVVMEARGFEYFPRRIEMQAGIPTTLTVRNNQVIGCAAVMSFAGLYPQVVMLDQESKTIEFTPQKGNYKITCTMGMVDPINVVVK